MYGADEMQEIDPYNNVEQEIDGCKIRVRFVMERNELIERQVLGHLMLMFDRRVNDLSYANT